MTYTNKHRMVLIMVVNQQITNKQPANNQQITTTKEYKKERIEEYTHTLVDTKKGVVGGKETEAVELIEWIATNAPCIASMPEPITAAQAVWLLQDYNVKDIRRLIAKQAGIPQTHECLYGFCQLRKTRQGA